MASQTPAPVKKKRLTQTERTALSDNRMFEAAISLILEKGTVNTTLREIGEKANYSRGLASYRFGTKENLYRELLVRIEKSWSKRFHAEVQGLRGLAAFKKTLEMFEEILRADIQAYQAAMIVRFESVGSNSETSSRTRTVMDIQRRQVANWIQQAIDDGHIKARIDPHEFSTNHISFLYGTMYQLVLFPDRISKEFVVESYYKSVMQIFGITETKSVLTKACGQSS